MHDAALSTYKNTVSTSMIQLKSLAVSSIYTLWYFQLRCLKLKFPPLPPKIKNPCPKYQFQTTYKLALDNNNKQLKTLSYIYIYIEREREREREREGQH